MPTSSTTSWMTAWNSGESASNSSLWTRTVSSAGCSKSSYRILSARPDSPGPEVSNTIDFIGTTMLNAKSVTITPSHPRIAILRCRPLQRAICAARL